MYALPCTDPLHRSAVASCLRLLQRVNSQCITARFAREPASDACMYHWGVHYHRCMYHLAYHHMLHWHVSDVLSVLSYMLALQVMGDEPRSLMERLRRVRLKKVTTLTIKAPQDTPTHDERKLLRASLRLLHALPCKPEKLVFQGWHATAAIISEFQALLSIPCLKLDEPAECTLSLHMFSNASVPPPPSTWPIARLAQFLPSKSFSKWVVDGSTLHAHELEALILSAPASAPHARFCVELAGVSDRRIGCISSRLVRLGTYEHITVVAKKPEES